MSVKITWRRLFQRLRWDLMDKRERTYYVYWLIWQIPGAFGNLLRAKYMSKKMKSAGEGLKILPGCRFRSIENLSVGRYVSLGYDNFLQARAGLTIGDFVTTAPGVKIWSVNHDYMDPDKPVEAQGHTFKPVTIGNNVFIASNAFILPGAQIPDGCVISAGAVVGGKTYRPYSILAGNPARVIGYRGGRAPGQEGAEDQTATPETQSQAQAQVEA